MTFKAAISRREFEAKDRKAIVNMEGRQIAIRQGPHGVLRALDNRCPHEGYPLIQGSIDGKGVLTCAWHNWKFNMDSGECILGGDNVRVYPVKEADGQIWVDPSGPPKEVVLQNLLKGLKVAVDRRQYGRTARELARFHFSGIDLNIPLRTLIQWSHDRLEFGMGHAYAAMADWMTLAEENEADPSTRILCLTEAVDYVALDALRHPRFPYHDRILPYDSDAFLAAIESEDFDHALNHLNGAFDSGVSTETLERDFASAALQHYNDFGHCLIYVQKCFELGERLGQESLQMLLKALLRKICFATREDLLPEFANYAETHGQLTSQGFAERGEITEALQPCSATKAMKWVVEQAKTASNVAIFDHLTLKNAQNLLHYDIELQYQTENKVTENIGWLDFTHALTFGNATRTLCQRHPRLWSAGLLQLACFFGRNAKFTDPSLDTTPWRVQDAAEFHRAAEAKIMDHGLAIPIFPAHLLKTHRAIKRDCEAASPQTRQALLDALNRFLNSPIKQKHTRRLVNQGIALVQKDYR